MRRRDLLVGSACAVSAGAAVALKPRRRLSRLGAAILKQIAPDQVGDWSSWEVSGLAPPSTSDSLVTDIYDQLVERVYQRKSTGEEIMMLLAHGASQTNDLQLHRPEGCYPAFGYEILYDRIGALQIPPGVLLPTRRLVADAPGRRECIVYWTRIGDSLPTSYGAQRASLLANAMAGFVCDGVLARFSVVNLDIDRSFAMLEHFVLEFLRAVRASSRQAFIGDQLSELISSNGRA